MLLNLKMKPSQVDKYHNPLVAADNKNPWSTIAVSIHCIITYAYDM